MVPYRADFQEVINIYPSLKCQLKQHNVFSLNDLSKVHPLEKPLDILLIHAGKITATTIKALRLTVK